jgi:cytochrome c oxidase cbb3-type subunit 3
MNDKEIKQAKYAAKKGEIVIREHEYDGIREFDQKLPNWWLFTFFGAVAYFLAAWITYYNTGNAATDEQKIIREVTAVQQKKDAELAATIATLDDVTLTNKWATDTVVLNAGHATFSTYCVACHAEDLSASMVAGNTKVPLPGLPLNDGKWKYGARPMEIFKLINNGTPTDSPGHNGAKMQAWGQSLSPKQIAEVTAYLISKNPADFSH